MLIPQIRKQNTLFKEGAEFFHQNNFVESIIFWILMTCLPRQWTRSAMKIYIPINQEVYWLLGCASKTDLVQMGERRGEGNSSTTVTVRVVSWLSNGMGKLSNLSLGIATESLIFVIKLHERLGYSAISIQPSGCRIEISSNWVTQVFL